MSILDAMMNYEIKSLIPYLTYLALSTNIEVDIPKVGKGHGKGVTRKKKAKKSTSIVIGKEIPKELNKEALDLVLFQSDENKAKEGKAIEDQDGEEPSVDDQSRMGQARGEQAKVYVPEPAVPNPSSSLTLSYSEYELEKKVKKLSKVDHVEAIKEFVQANIFNKVKNQLSKLPPKAVSNFVQPRMERAVCDVLQKNLINLFQSPSTYTDSLTEYELKNMLHDKMQKSKTPSKPSSTDKSVNTEETVHEDAIEADETMEVEDDVVYIEEKPQDDAPPKQDNFI
nr:hypothetical protein [Tanacetum cinerariifolium]